MLDLPLRGESPQTELPLGRPPEPDEEPAARAPRPPGRRAPDRRRRPRRHERRRRWPLFLILLLALAAAAFAVYRYTTPVAGFSVETLAFGEQQVGGTSEPLAVTVTNTGSRAMSLTGVRFTGEAAGEFAVVSDDCSGSTRQGGESCTVEVAFAPAANGPRAAALDLTGNAIGRLPVTGVGAAPVLTVDRAEIDFGPQPVDGRAASRALNLSNDGATPMAISEVAVDGGHAADFSISQRCTSGALPPGDSCAVRIEFTPRAAGERDATLRIASDGAPGPTTVSLKGAGVWSGQPLDAAPKEIDFGKQRRGRASKPVRVAFINRTSEPVEVADVRLDAGGSGIEIESQSCRQITLAAGEECGVELRFTPADDGKAAATVAVRTAGGLETAVQLSGTGVEPRLKVEKSSLDFGELRVGFETRQRAVLSNSGTATLAFRGATLGGPQRSEFSKGKDGCSGFTLEPGRTCTIEIAFQPRRTGRSRAELRIESDAAGGARTIGLEGSGTAAELSVDALQLDFGSVQRPGSARQTLTLRNEGSARLRITRVSVTGAAAADFVVSSIGCGESGLAAGGSCQVTVSFAPRADGARAARLVIQHDGDGPTKEISLVGVAMPAVAGFALSPRSIDFGTRQVGSRSSVQTVTVSNPGDGRLELRGVSIEGAQAGEFTVVPGTCDGAPYVAPKSSCTIGVRFTPGAGGSRRATLRIRHNAGADGTVALGGQGAGG